MPHPIAPLQIRPLNDNVRKASQIGAEVLLPESMKLFDPNTLTESEKSVIRQGFFDHGVLVVKGQTGLDPRVLYDIADLFDADAEQFHSGGKKQVTDPRNILSQNNCARIPRAPQVTVIGSGHIEGHEGIKELDLKHLVGYQSLSSFPCWPVLIQSPGPIIVP